MFLDRKSSSFNFQPDFHTFKTNTIFNEIHIYVERVLKLENIRHKNWVNCNPTTQKCNRVLNEKIQIRRVNKSTNTQ